MFWAQFRATDVGPESDGEESMRKTGMGGDAAREQIIADAALAEERRMRRGRMGSIPAPEAKLAQVEPDAQLGGCFRGEDGGDHDSQVAGIPGATLGVVRPGPGEVG
ncbi:hypothetical protein COU18_03720 [Candidatus Kaiserbacteria bacterium CG10_big_fil_rev_8_21_14_0_10_51_14]|uniref:Uncharacterized protein n=1 Tax=Candidatus Kaiserbacteria bacterium CG10_big_fil_rev_8_21_14_0_10_51_14 TaxID=1974610 RepID=A0A2H0UBF2_9BACT|nr:MAG: hypothetical protein COU18_03720 [Candidatus Kaiserbacteria bacterium CG10_big_fil_rev_8_21_14_0_10_51_14]